MTKIKTVATAIALIVAAFFLWPLMANTNIDTTRSEDLREVMVMVDFEPTDRTGGSPGDGRQLAEDVIVTLVAGPDNYPAERARKSPWIRTVYIRKGQMVTVTAQQFYGVRMGCAISQEGAPTEHKNAFGPAVITCRHVVM